MPSRLAGLPGLAQRVVNATRRVTMRRKPPAAPARLGAPSAPLGGPPTEWYAQLDRIFAAQSPERYALERSEGTLGRRLSRIVATSCRMWLATQDPDDRRSIAENAVRALGSSEDEPPGLDDILGWTDELHLALRASSPESYEVSFDDGSLDRAIEHALHRGGPARSENLRDLITYVHEHLATRPASPISEDPALWSIEINSLIAKTAPEAYAEAERMGRLEPHVRALVEDGKRRLSCGALPSSVVMDLIQAAADPIPPRLDEVLQSISADEVVDLLGWHVLRRACASEEATETVTRRVVQAALANPRQFMLMEHPLLESEGGAEVTLLWYVRGARAFVSGEFDRALAYFRRAQGLGGGLLALNAVLGCLRGLGRNEEMVREAAGAAGSPQYGDGAYISLAHALFITGDTCGANEAFSQVREQWRANHLEYLEVAQRATPELVAATNEGSLYRPHTTDVYDDVFARKTWWNYWRHFNQYNRRQHPEGILGEVVPELLKLTLDALGERPRTVVEVGVMCAEPLARVAHQYPDVSFIGLDRNLVVRQLNEQAYPLANMQFVEADALEWVNAQGTSLDGGLLFHVRTAPFLYPAYLRALYGAASQAGVKYIALIEAYGLSLATLEYVELSEMHVDAEVRGGGLYHHRYPAYLLDAGFRISQCDHVRNPLLEAGLDSTVFILATRPSAC
jgi:hypothetical protein